MNCKVIATSFIGDREVRTTSKFPQHNQRLETKDDILEMLKHLVTWEQSWDAGTDVDSIFVIGGKRYEEGEEYLLSFDGTPTRNGVIKVFRNDNIGGSFGAYNSAFEKYDYDYWLFTEDDIFVGGHLYYKNLVESFEQRESRKGIGFMALIRSVQNHPLGIHADGGVGLTSKKILQQVKEKHGCLPHYKNEKWDRPAIIRDGEIAFTKAISDLGYEIAVYNNEKNWGLLDKYCQPYYDIKA